jgi:hypothetical protein
MVFHLQSEPSVKVKGVTGILIKKFIVLCQDFQVDGEIVPFINDHVVTIVQPYAR